MPARRLWWNSRISALLEVLKDKTHPEYREMKRWAGRGYDPERFDLEKINKELPKFKSFMGMWKK